MKRFISPSLICSVLALTLCLSASLAVPLSVVYGDEHENGAEHEEEAPEGPHGGRLLTDGTFSVEVTIFEKGQEPQFRVFAFENGRALDVKQVTARIELERFSGPREVFELAPISDYLTSAKTVEEPHSFRVTLNARFGGAEHQFAYDSFEGRTELSDAALRVANPVFEKVGPQKIDSIVPILGKIVANEDKISHITPRFPGIVLEVKKKLGDSVVKGELLAVIESNQSLQPYEVRSAVTGIVLRRHLSLGEYVPDSKEVFTVGDLSEVAVDFQIYSQQFGAVKLGDALSIDVRGDGENLRSTSVSYISPITDEATQSKTVRAVLSNPDLQLRPGLFVTGSLTTTAVEVPLAVRRTGVQSFRDWKVVYLSDGKTFQAAPLRLGREGSEYVEVLSGLESGQQYVAKNSFIVKADIEKSGAAHPD